MEATNTLAYFLKTKITKIPVLFNRSFEQKFDNLKVIFPILPGADAIKLFLSEIY
jgi:hypothetical protein